MSAFDLTASLARAQARLALVGEGTHDAARSGEHPIPAAPRQTLRWGALPAEVRDSLYNLGHPGDDQELPAELVAFHAFNHGTVRALSFASALPLASLERAARMRGWRPKSLALLEAVLRRRAGS